MADIERMVANCNEFFGPERNAFTKSAEEFLDSFKKKLAKETAPPADAGDSAADEGSVAHPADVGDGAAAGAAVVEDGSGSAVAGESAAVVDTTSAMVVDGTEPEAGSVVVDATSTAGAAGTGDAGVVVDAMETDAGAAAAAATTTSDAGAGPATSPLPSTQRSDSASAVEIINALNHQPHEDMRACAMCNRVGDFPDDDGGRLIPVPPPSIPPTKGDAEGAGEDESGVPESTTWIHANCMLWSAEVYETDTGEIKEVHSALRRGKQLRCTECGQMGATVGCCHRSCKGNFHFACARKHGAVFTRKSEVFCQTCVPKVSRDA